VSATLDIARKERPRSGSYVLRTTGSCSHVKGRRGPTKIFLEQLQGFFVRECLDLNHVAARGEGSRFQPRRAQEPGRGARVATNKGNILTLDEYKAGLKGQGSLEARFNNFNNFDQNGNGKLTREEFVGPSAK